MTSRPKVHREEVVRAIRKIAERREKIADRHRERLPDAHDADPREILDYLRSHTGAGVPTWVHQADVCDSLVLLNWLWWEDRRRELQVLRAGMNQGMYLAQLGAALGLGKQGVRDRIDRLDALLRYDHPDEKLIREERRRATSHHLVAKDEKGWLEGHAQQLADLILAIEAEADRYELDDDEREWLDELVVDAREESFTPATIVMLGYATAALRTAPAVLSLPAGVARRSLVHKVLEQADRLRSDFAAVGSRSKH